MQKDIRDTQKMSKIARNWNRNDYTGIAVPRVPTGYTALDQALGGGLIPGIHCIGAMSTLGKSAFVGQMIDQMAAQGHCCLHFSLEVAKNVIVAKSISRQMYMDDPGAAKTPTELMDNRVMAKFKDSEWQNVEKAAKKVEEIGDKIWIMTGSEGYQTAADIAAYVDEWVAKYQDKPVVVIDYVQLLDASAQKTYTEKQKIDESMKILQKSALQYAIPIIIISSFNRQSYKEVVSMQSFKESGSLEFSAETLIGLQLRGAGTKEFDYKKALADNPRKVELYILKSKNSAILSECLQYKFYTSYCYFAEQQEGKRDKSIDYEGNVKNRKSKKIIKRDVRDFI